ncbi:MAG: repair protein radA protein [Candidatus Woesebacteria bacterium GW2011_GWE1_45_18]|uniref:DNA repair protein RadA n=5 Tax=Candidatus Woeseibacteriota TaxID=1752722 RepID=A0A1F8DBJ8_9BACT|nr:MAG: repair protein radA protein [Candidatus Woesebacteria bacterium GW2011_GWE1_45_18]OGM78736.1 MAG: DNA repair protein RadA [Candidatus Woesebacteria bacterium RIFOXYA1_FULL_48_16]OGM85145.1 MAG: DNA repair protein RadA [Candidatus Woesebacteria bacterium RIFOXYC1_FULL_46_16]OGM90121.1 MAG: DNA repair protein RadA [Candidatus Woesebacteria bacterium RIFOXYD1_FULL_46_19]
MAKAHSQYVCQQCGYSQVGWAGKCPNCNSWGSLVETLMATGEGRKGKTKGQKKAEPISLTAIPFKRTSRLSTKISELDRVLGGGLVPGQVVLIAGEPGIGKSTILLQLADKIGKTLYVSGEESAVQVKVRADRLGIKSKTLKFLEETDVDTIVDSFDGPSLVVIDSIQTMTTDDLSGLAGSVGQVRECAFRLLKRAKEGNIPLFMVGHVTKEGTVAGPAVLAHIVDTVLWFEGDKSLTLRLLRAVKNRFGPTDEVGIFEMEDRGLLPLTNAEKIFLTKARAEVPGSVVSSILQGTRPLLVEIQSLVVPTKMAFPKRVAQGVDARRLEMLLAVLIRRCGLPLYEYDVFVNVAGGIKVVEPAADLAIILSIASSFFDKPVAKNIMALGEVGLLGEVREVVAEEKRVKEAKRLGFTHPVTQKEIKYVKEVVKKLLR